jgi:hypothetical protein
MTSIIPASTLASSTESIPEIKGFKRMFAYCCTEPFCDFATQNELFLAPHLLLHSEGIGGAGAGAGAGSGFHAVDSVDNDIIRFNNSLDQFRYKVDKRGEKQTCSTLRYKVDKRGEKQTCSTLDGKRRKRGSYLNFGDMLAQIGVIEGLWPNAEEAKSEKLKQFFRSDFIHRTNTGVIWPKTWMEACKNFENRSIEVQVARLETSKFLSRVGQARRRARTRVKAEIIAESGGGGGTSSGTSAAASIPQQPKKLSMKRPFMYTCEVVNCEYASTACSDLTRHKRRQRHFGDTSSSRTPASDTTPHTGSNPLLVSSMDVPVDDDCDYADDDCDYATIDAAGITDLNTSFKRQHRVSTFENSASGGESIIHPVITTLKPVRRAFPRVVRTFVASRR